MMSMDTMVSFDTLVYDPVKVQFRLEAYSGPGFKLGAAIYPSQRSA